MTKPKKTSKRIIVNTEAYEHEIQSSFYELVEWSSNDELKKIFAIPNGGHRHPSVAKKMKEEGVKAGVLDNFLPVSRGGYHGLWLEFKSRRRRYSPENPEDLLSDEQFLFARQVRKDGYLVIVHYDAMKAFEACEHYLSMRSNGDGRNIKTNLGTVGLEGEKGDGPWEPSSRRH